MTELNIREYKVDAMDQFTSDFLNQVTNDFTNSIVKLYSELKTIIDNYNKYNSIVNLGLDWFAIQLGAMTVSPEYTITGYTEPLEHENINHNKLFGQVYLKELNTEPKSKIGRYEHDGKMFAYISNKTYINGYESSSLRKVINDKNNIWHFESDLDTITISIEIPSYENKANIITIVPFAGTLIKEVSYRKTNGTWENYNAETYNPFQIVGNFDFYRELKIVLCGILKNNKYHYSLRYIDVYDSDFISEGYILYDIGKFSEISNIEINSDYIKEELKPRNPISIQILSWDESETFYDSNIDPFPLEKNINISDTPQNLKMKLILRKEGNTTPVIKWVKIDGKKT